MSVTMNKEGWPEFPFNGWTSIEKWDMSGLKLIANHLEGKTRFRRQASSSFPLPVSGIEEKLFERITNLEQQVFELEDTVQALLQLIDDNRPSQRIRRVVRLLWEPARRYNQRLQQNTIIGVLSLIALVAFAGGILYSVARYILHWFGR